MVFAGIAVPHIKNINQIDRFKVFSALIGEEGVVFKNKKMNDLLFILQKNLSIIRIWLYRKEVQKNVEKLHKNLDRDISYALDTMQTSELKPPHTTRKCFFCK